MRIIEMMIVVFISIILSAVAWFNFSPLLVRARTAADKHEMELVVSAIIFRETDTGVLPATLSTLAPVYFRVGSNFDKDSKYRPYIYNTTARTLCSVSNGCLDF